jgi:DNA-binding transcriptional LysR family regulator
VQLKLVTGELQDLPALLKSGALDFLVLDEVLPHEGWESVRLGEEKSVLVQKRGYTGPEIYLDHDESDLTTAKYLRKKTATGLRRCYLDDIYGILDGVRLGLGRAVVPVHLVSKRTELEVLDPGRVLSVPVVLHHFRQPFYSKLHQAVVSALVERCPRFLF